MDARESMVERESVSHDASPASLKTSYANNFFFIWIFGQDFECTTNRHAIGFLNIFTEHKNGNTNNI